VSSAARSRARLKVNLEIRINQRQDADDHRRPERDLQDAQAVRDFLVAPLCQPSVDFVELAVDARFDFVEFLIDVRVRGFFDAPGDATEEAGLLRSRP
jgi:hypothetical protein